MCYSFLGVWVVGDANSTLNVKCKPPVGPCLRVGTKLETFVALPSGRRLVHACVPKQCSGNGRRRELNILSPFILPYVLHHIIAKTDVCEVISQMTGCEFGILLLSSLQLKRVTVLALSRLQSREIVVGMSVAC